MNAQTDLHLPPQAVEAEQSILGALMLVAGLFDDVASIVSVDDFYRADHRAIFTAIDYVNARGNPVDVVTVSDHLDGTGQLEAAGGLTYLAEITRDVPMPGNAKAYASIVRERAVLRRVIETAQSAIKSCYQPDGATASEIIDNFSRDAGQLSISKTDSNNQRLNVVLGNSVDRIEDRFKSGDKLGGISTGFVDLDHKTNGLQDGRLYVIAGRPSMGKTTLAMNCCEHICANGGTVQIFTMEMPNEEIGNKLLSSVGAVNYGRINKPATISDDDWPKLTSSIGLMQDWKMFIDDSTNVSVEKIRSTCRRTQKEYGLDVVMVDYLQLMQYPKADRADQSIGMITKALKSLAKELGVPIILLSQLNRGLESRPNKRPVMSDLRESGAIEQDADSIWFIYRDEVYNPGTDAKGLAEIIMGKQRGGVMGAVARLVFRGELQKFESYASGYN